MNFKKIAIVSALAILSVGFGAKESFAGDDDILNTFYSDMQKLGTPVPENQETNAVVLRNIKQLAPKVCIAYDLAGVDGTFDQLAPKGKTLKHRNVFLITLKLAATENCTQYKREVDAKFATYSK